MSVLSDLLTSIRDAVVRLASPTVPPSIPQIGSRQQVQWFTAQFPTTDYVQLCPADPRRIVLIITNDSGHDMLIKTNNPLAVGLLLRGNDIFMLDWEHHKALTQQEWLAADTLTTSIGVAIGVSDLLA